MTELQSLLNRWQAKKNEPMPAAIQSLPIAMIRTAVERTEAGDHVFVPQHVLRETDAEESMMTWDRHGEFT